MVTLSAVADAVPVVVRSMPPVQVSNWPPTDSVAWWTLGIAIAGASIALITMVGVGLQILLARREVDYVKRDLENNERQLNELMRRPKLSLNILVTPWLLITMPDYFPVILRLFVTNGGTKSAHEVMVELLVPEEVLERTPLNTEDTDNDQTGPTKPVYGIEAYNKRHERFDIKAPKDSVLYSNGSTLELKCNLCIKRNADTFTMYYRIYDQYDTYPRSGEHVAYTFDCSVFDGIRESEAEQKAEAQTTFDSLPLEGLQRPPEH